MRKTNHNKSKQIANSTDHDHDDDNDNDNDSNLKNPENNNNNKTDNDMSKKFGARIVVQTNSSDTSVNRKLYIPPQLRGDEEMDIDVTGNGYNDLNDISHDITHDVSDENDTISGCALFIDGFRRPLTLRKVEQGLKEYGTIKSFKMNAIKSLCYVVMIQRKMQINVKKRCKICFSARYTTIHAGKLNVKNVKMIEAMSFIQGMKGNGVGSISGHGINTRRLVMRSFETKQKQRGNTDITVETRTGTGTGTGSGGRGECQCYLFLFTSKETI